MAKHESHRGQLYQHKDHLYHLAPIPLVMRESDDADLENWHAQLIADARDSLSHAVLEVPDVRHIEDMGSPPTSVDVNWSEQQNTPVGVWHKVPTNQFLDIKTPAVRRLRLLIEECYLRGLAGAGVSGVREAYISESWIQFYTNGDYKVLHNHERYGPPYPNDRWVGAYYIDDGSPDPTMPYTGVLSFRVRNENHFIRPRAGLLLIWPADILHEVHPFYGSSERVVVNFNINSSPVVWPEEQ